MANKHTKDGLKSYLENLRKTEDANMHKMHDIVLKSLEEEEGLVNILYQISSDKELKFKDKLSDSFTGLLGRWSFIIYFLTVLAVWISYNIFSGIPFDPYPFILLNLFLSFLAGFQAPIIMMSQNRQAAKDKIRAENDYLINLKSEIQIRELKQKLDILLVDYLDNMVDIQTRQMSGIEEILERLEALETPEK